jgi:ketosteroid isomerase-like protein
MRSIPMALLMVATLGAGGGSKTADPDAAIRAVLDAQVAAWNQGDIDAFMDGYKKSESTAFVDSSGILRGWQAVLDRYHKSYPNRQAMGTLTFSNLEITVLSPSAALVMGHWQLQRQLGKPGGVFTLVFRKFPEGWRIINDHTSQAAGAIGH